jgi:hypothetical protein
VKTRFSASCQLSAKIYFADSQKKVLGEKASLPRAFLFSLSKEKFKLKFEVVN